MDSKEEEIGHAGYVTRAVFNAAVAYAKTTAGSPTQENELMYSALMIGVQARRDLYIERLRIDKDEAILRATNAELAAREAQRLVSQAHADVMNLEFTSLEMEAALCVWEWMLDEGAALVEAWRDEVGAVEVRHASYSIGRYCLKIYDLGKQIAGQEAWGGVPYDWEVIPAICEALNFGPGFGWIAPATDEEIARRALERVEKFRLRQEEPTPIIEAFRRASKGLQEMGKNLNEALRKNPQAEALAALVLEMADAVDAAAEDVGTGSRGPMTILREAVKVAEGMKKPQIKNDPANYKAVGAVQAGIAWERDLADASRDWLQTQAPAERGDLSMIDAFHSGARWQKAQPIHRVRHANGGKYSVLGVGSLQAAPGSDIQEGAQIVFYRADIVGSLWARELSEFEDGRFETI